MTTQWPGHAAEEVERLITVPLETEMNGLPNLVVSARSRCTALSSIRVTFTDGTDLYFARQQVFERLARRGAARRRERRASRRRSRRRDSCTATCIQSSDRSPMDLHVMQDWVLDKAFRAVPGVADVASLGGETMQYQVLVDPTRLAGAGLAINDVATALERQQQQRRRRLLLRGRPVLLRARARPRRDARGHRQHRPRREEQRAGAREGRRHRRDRRTRRGSGQFGFNRSERRRRRHHPDAHRRAGADGAQARRGEDAGAQRPRAAQGREGRPVLRPQRSRRAHDAHRVPTICSAASCSSSSC